MKLIKFKILFLILLSFAPRAFAKNTCHSLFEVARPSNAEINLAIGELKSLAAHRYSKDAETARVSNILYQAKLRELEKYITTEEIKDRFLKIKLPRTKATKLVRTNKSLTDTLATIAEVESYLSQHGFPNILGINSEGYYPAAHAAKENRIELMKKLIASGADVHAKGNRPALHVAINKNDFSLVKLLINKYKVDVNTTNSKGLPALINATIAGRTNIVQFLVKNNVDVNARENHGLPALYFASSRGELDIVKILVKNKADVNAAGTSGISPLLAAAAAGRADVVKVLIENNADVNQRSIHGRAPLHAAAEKGRDQVISILLSSNANPNIPGVENRTPLMEAVKNRQVTTVKLLLDHGVDTTLQNSKGLTALGMTNKIKRKIKSVEEIKKLLIEAGAKE